MFYRRNSDTRLRSLERALHLTYTLENLLSYNQELLRHGMPTVVATQTMVRQAVGNLLPNFYVWEISDLQFPGLEIRLRMVRDATSYPVLPRTLEHFMGVDIQIRTAIPLLLNLGWVALVKQCGEVTLRITKNGNYDEWIVVWRVDGVIDDNKSYYTDDKQDAEQTLQSMAKDAHPAQYPEIIALPRTVMGPSGRPVLTNMGYVVADQWRRGENPLSLERPEFRTGTNPTAIILVDRSQDLLDLGQTSPKDYVTWAYCVPYEEGRRPSTDGGHYDMTLEEAKVDYLQRLLKLPAECSYELFES